MKSFPSTFATTVNFIKSLSGSFLFLFPLNSSKKSKQLSFLSHDLMNKSELPCKALRFIVTVYS